MNELEVLREARSLLETRWCRDTNERVNRNNESHYCLVGALNKVTGIPMDFSSTRERKPILPWGRKQTRAKVMEMIEARIPGGYIEGFNDWEGKRAVLRMLDGLIAELEPKDMDTGKPEKEYTIEPAEPIPGIKESPAPMPEPSRKTPKPEREKVPA